MSELWRFHLLGELRAVQGDRSITRFRTTKTGGLMAYLVLHRGRTHARDMLIDLFWTDSSVTAARNSLSVALNSLRQQFEPSATPGSGPHGDFLIADRNTVQLRGDAFSSDVSDFEAAVAAIPSGGSVHVQDALLHAERLYHGDLLPGYFDDWVVAERERLIALYLQVVHRLIAAFLAQGDRDRALEFAHRAMRADPLDEETSRLLALLTHPIKTGDSGIRTIPEVSVPVPSPPVPVAPATTNVPNPFPVQFTRFFGRDQEIQQVEAMLGSNPQVRLLTLTGPGGAGKTRLAIESAARLQKVLPGGVYFVSLVDLSTPALIANAVRDAMGLPRTVPTTPLAQVTAALADSETCLLVLDNLEHLMGKGPLDSDGAASVVRALLRASTTTLILATSRQLLGLPEERELPVAPLPSPSVADHPVEELLRYPAVQLFVNRAQTRRVDFRLTGHNAPAVVRLCARLEGMPLAIELAASWAKLFTPAQMLEKLDAGFAFLESRHPSVPARHRSLWAAAAWSYVLLAPEIQRFFARLSVFRGGCTPEAAAFVCGDDGDPLTSERALDYLTRLYDASLLVTEEAPAGTGEQIRLRLREPIRDFADGQLTSEERAETVRRHTAYFVRLSEEAGKHLTGPEQRTWFDHLEADNDNLRAVLLRHTGDENGLRIAGALGRFWTIRGYLREGTDWLAQVLSAPGNRADSHFRALALTSAGTVAYHRGDFAAARTDYEESLRVGEGTFDTAAIAKILLNLGNIAYRQGDNADAETRYQEVLILVRSTGDEWGIASALGSLGNVAQGRGEYAAARRYQEESLGLSRKLGDARMTAYTLHNLGNLASLEEDRDRARFLYEESLQGKRALGDRRGVASLLLSLSYLALQSGDYQATQERLVEAIPLIRAVEDRIGMISALDCVAWYAQTAGSGYETSAVFWAASEANRIAIDFPRAASDESLLGSLQEIVRQSVPQDRFAGSWARGSALSLDAAILLALAEVNLDKATSSPPA